jgi:hypothetical protein
LVTQEGSAAQLPAASSAGLAGEEEENAAAVEVLAEGLGDGGAPEAVPAGDGEEPLLQAAIAARPSGRQKMARW